MPGRLTSARLAEEVAIAEQDAEIHIRALMREILRAFRAHDAAALDLVLADEFAFSDAGGRVRSKQRWLADITSGDLVFASIEAGEVEFSDLGERAVVVGNAQVQARHTHGDYNGAVRYLGVYTKHGGDWKLELTSAERGDSE